MEVHGGGWVAGEEDLGGTIHHNLHRTNACFRCVDLEAETLACVMDGDGYGSVVSGSPWWCCCISVGEVIQQ